MIATKTNIAINLLAGTGAVIGIAVGDAIPEVEKAATVGFMDYLNYYSDALGTMFAGITCMAFIGFNIWRMIRERKGK